jgi:hypothetical protein
MKDIKSLQIILLLVITLSSCTKENSSNSSSSNVDVVGTNIYVAGMDISGQNFVAAYWKNGVKTQLSNNYSYTYDIFVNGSDVYVVGFEGLNTHYPVLWKNGVKTQLSTSPGEAESVFVSGSDVYVCGTEYLSTTNSGKTVAFLWKNGVKTRYGTSSGASSVFVNGYDVFIAGYNLYNNGASVTYWQNGSIPNSLLPTKGYASSIYVSGSELYMVGKDFTTGLPTLWRRTFGGVSNTHTKTPLSTNTNSEAYSVSVLGSDTYIAGFEGGACYWKNGVRTQLSDNKESSTGEVFTFGKDFYIAGRGGNNLTAGYWENGIRTEVSSTIGSYATSIFVN